MILIGWANKLDSRRAKTRYRVAEVVDELVRVVFEQGGVLVDGGTDAGVMRLAAESFAERRSGSEFGDAQLIGVYTETEDGKPIGTVERDSHDESISVSAPKPGLEAETMVREARTRAGDAPVIAVVAGGGRGASREFRTLQHLRIPTLIVGGCGTNPLNRFLRLRTNSNTQRVRSRISTTRIQQQLRWALNQEREELEPIWLRVDAYERVSKRNRRGLRAGRAIALLLGIGTALAAVLPGVLGKMPSEAETVTVAASYVVVLAPLLATLVFGWISRRQRDERFAGARAAAEKLKHDLYRFRAAPAPNSEALAVHCGNIEREAAPRVTVRSSDSSAWIPRALVSALSDDDDPLEPLSPANYASVRLNHQIAYYESQGHKRYRREGLAVFILYAVSFATPFFAFDLWPPIEGTPTNWFPFAAVMATISAAVATYAGHEQWMHTSSRMAAAAADLRSIQRLVQAEAIDPQRLVEQTEMVLLAEQSDWLSTLTRAGSTLKDIRPGVA